MKSMKLNNKEIIFRFLNLNERKVIKKLVESKGTVLQSEINLMEGMTKLKTHRAVRDLERKSIIKTEAYGKTNRIFLSKEILALDAKTKQYRDAWYVWLLEHHNMEYNDQYHICF